MTQHDAEVVAREMFGPMMRPEHEAFAWREISTGKYVVGFAERGQVPLERWEAGSYASALKRAARVIVKCMPRSECEVRARRLLDGGR